MAEDKVQHRTDVASNGSGEPETEEDRVEALWRGHDFTVKVNGRWCLDGFIKWYLHAFEILRARDPNTYRQFPPRLCDPLVIALMHGIPPEEFGVTTLEDRMNNLVSRLEKLFQGETMPGLTPTQEMLLRAASETEPLTGESLAAEAKVTVNSNTRNCLASLVKLGLLHKVSRGYVKSPRGQNVMTNVRIDSQ